MQYNPTACTRSVYIHWPFCPYRCHFCPFVALASHESFMERYHKALCKEIRLFGETVSQKVDLDTVYIGGGTPSTYPNELLLDMFGTLKEVFNIDKQAEVTMEVNPGTVKAGQLALWRSVGVNRISVGVQSLKEKTLHALNRMQSTQDVYTLLDQAQGVIDNVSVDFILGLPGVSDREWKEYLQEAVTWPITHLSMYFLMVHEQTPLYFKVQRQEVDLPKDDAVVTLYHWSCDLLKKHGFEQYEVSNFARNHRRSRHNTVYWERKPYKAFGLGACSFDGATRFQNEKSLMKYLEGIEREQDISMFYEQLTQKEIRLEKIMLGIRRAEGIKWAVIMEGLSDQEAQGVRNAVQRLKKKKLINECDEYLTLTSAGLAVENAIVRELSL